MIGMAKEILPLLSIATLRQIRAAMEREIRLETDAEKKEAMQELRDAAEDALVVVLNKKCGV